jgi:hypothetical protein
LIIESQRVVELKVMGRLGLEAVFPRSAIRARLKGVVKFADERRRWDGQGVQREG